MVQGEVRLQQWIDDGPTLLSSSASNKNSNHVSSIGFFGKKKKKTIIGSKVGRPDGRCSLVLRLLIFSLHIDALYYFGRPARVSERNHVQVVPLPFNDITYNDT
jgi:hypothetical protein